MSSASSTLPRGKLKQSKQGTSVHNAEAVCNPWSQDAVDDNIYTASGRVELDEFMEEKIHLGLFKVLPLVQVDSEETIPGTGVVVLSLSCS